MYCSLVPQNSTPAAPVDLLRLARVVLRLQLGGMVLGAALVFYVLGVAAHHRNLGLAIAITATYLVLTGAGTLIIQRSWRARARRVSS